VNTSSRKHRGFSSLLIVALLGCCAVLTLSSCSKKASVAIIGKWRVQGQREILQFRKDSTFTSSGAGDTENGTYTFTDDSHMKVEINVGNSGTNAPIVVNCTVHIHGDAMDVAATMPGQSKPYMSHLKRVK
jgi:hypothetical protein